VSPALSGPGRYPLSSRRSTRFFLTGYSRIPWTGISFHSVKAFSQRYAPSLCDVSFFTSYTEGRLGPLRNDLDTFLTNE